MKEEWGKGVNAICQLTGTWNVEGSRGLWECSIKE